jgi:hypothetical protein
MTIQICHVVDTDSQLIRGEDMLSGRIAQSVELRGSSTGQAAHFSHHVTNRLSSTIMYLSLHTSQ